LSTNETRKSNDKLFYVYSKQAKTFIFYEFVSKENNDVLAMKIITSKVEDHPECKDTFFKLPFSKVGLFLYVARCRETVKIPITSVAGKAVLAGKYILSASYAILRETG